MDEIENTTVAKKTGPAVISMLGFGVFKMHFISLPRAQYVLVNGS